MVRELEGGESGEPCIKGRGNIELRGSPRRKGEGYPVNIGESARGRGVVGRVIKLNVN